LDYFQCPEDDVGPLHRDCLNVYTYYFSLQSVSHLCDVSRITCDDDDLLWGRITRTGRQGQSEASCIFLLASLPPHSSSQDANVLPEPSRVGLWAPPPVLQLHISVRKRMRWLLLAKYAINAFDLVPRSTVCFVLRANDLSHKQSRGICDGCMFGCPP